MSSNREPRTPPGFESVVNSVFEEQQRAGVTVSVVELQDVAGKNGSKYDDCEEADVYMIKAPARSLWVRRARHISYVSIAFTLLGGVSGIVIASVSDSVSLLGYALESFVDVFSSVLVLWRFWSDDIEKHEQKRLFKKEKKASLGIAATLVIIGLVVGTQAAVHLALDEQPNKAAALLAISTISVIVLTILSTIKLKISRALNSPAMKKDAVTSAAVALLSLGILLSAAMNELHPEIWWLDAAFAIIISVLLFFYGARTLINNKWWRKDFWAMQDQ
ncbi:hypothetical protein BSKO_00081 [Bryopsis sp. KO-2023]|nr:hypothetical protein BSKO_00081 [Bryopsis sp. KO-2023]